MKKIMKRLLTGILTLATVFTTLPVTQVHAADSVYTTTDGKAGIIVKIDNGGSEVKSFEESIMTADGQIAYCVDINTDFQSGYKNRVDAKDRMSADQISDVALNLEYVKQYSKTHSLSNKQIQKRDLETKDTKPQGGATLKDTEFTITTLNDNPVLVDGKSYSKNEVIKTIHTGVDGIAATAADTLPFGHYRLDEVTPPKGYLKDGAVSRAFDIVNNGEIVDLTDEAHSVYNQIKRGDLEGVKIGDGTHKRLANVPFRLTSKTTGESHIIVTDANGQFSTSSEWVSHKQNTNAGKSSEDGIWFGTSTPDDSKGALLYDTYTIEELRCDSNKGMTLIPAFDVVVSRNKTVIDLGTLTDNYEPEISIHTTATDKAISRPAPTLGKETGNRLVL